MFALLLYALLMGGGYAPPAGQLLASLGAGWNDALTWVDAETWTD